MAHRTFTDTRGVQWEVWEVHPTLAERRRAIERRRLPRPSHERRIRVEARALTRADLAHGWLAFRSEAERRRRAPIPPGWQSMTTPELEELLEAAERAGGIALDGR